MGGSVSSYSPWRRAIAAVAIAGYFGCLAGPPLIGLAADTVGLPAALAIVGGACAVVAVGASLLSPPRSIPVEHAGSGNSTTNTEGSHG
jgi:hypothetical protein